LATKKAVQGVRKATKKPAGAARRLASTTPTRAGAARKPSQATPKSTRAAKPPVSSLAVIIARVLHQAFPDRFPQEKQNSRTNRLDNAAAFLPS